MDTIKIRLMKHKPTASDLASPTLSKDAMTIFNVAMKKAGQDQNQLLKKAKSL